MAFPEIIGKRTVKRSRGHMESHLDKSPGMCYDNHGGIPKLFLPPLTAAWGGKKVKMEKYECPCGYVYDPEKGDPDAGVAPGTKFEDLPEDWVCPVCGLGKEEFSKA